MRTMLAAAMLVAAVIGPAPAALSAQDNPPPPTEADIRALFQDQRSAESVSHRLAYRDATLLELRLLELMPVKDSRMRAKVEAEFDFGPAPSGVIGYQRVRSGPYWLRLSHHDAAWALQGLTPVARKQYETN